MLHDFYSMFWPVTNDIVNVISLSGAEIFDVWLD